MFKQISVLLFCFIAFSALPSQANKPFSQDCDGRHLDRVDRGELARFDSELRHALHHQDVTALAALADYPLRVNSPQGGTILIANPQALQARWAELFPDELRAAVLKTRPADVACLSQGIMYGHGVLWVQGQIQGKGISYRIHALNLPETTPPKPFRDPPLAFVCETALHRIVIDEADPDSYRYRAWNKPRSLQGEPDMTVTAGRLSYDGRGLCATAQWQFPTGDTLYTVAARNACGAEVPEAARGQLRVTVAGKVQQTLWCQ